MEQKPKVVENLPEPAASAEIEILPVIYEIIRRFVLIIVYQF